MSDEQGRQPSSVSPLGVVALVAGVVLAFVFILRFHMILHHTQNRDLHSAIEALEITVVAVWIAVALWGWYLVRDGLERANTNKRLNKQDSTLFRIESAISAMDEQKEEQTKKSRSFWNWRQNEPTHQP